MHNLGFETDRNSTYYHLIVLMVEFNSTVNPFIYFIKYRDYQEALKQLLGFKKKEKETETGTVSIPQKAS